MKSITKILLFFLIATASVFMVSAASTLPSEDGVRGYINTANVSTDNYAANLFADSKVTNPSWNCDLWNTSSGRTVVSFYYASGNSKGYDSLYVSGQNEITSYAPDGLTLKEQYVGTSNNSTVSEPTNNSMTHGPINNSTVPSSTGNVSTCQSVYIGDTTKEQKLDEFMAFFENKDSVTLDDIKNEAGQVFCGDN